MPQRKRPQVTDEMSGAVALDAQIQQLRDIVERAEVVLAQLESFDTHGYRDSPVRRRPRVSIQ
jgi:hypothetical protein